MSAVDRIEDETRSLIVRVWLPDRPGALGQVASRIGSLRGDVTAIDILERGAGRVVDELVVALPLAASEQLLAKEVGAVDGVAVEHIRPARFERDDAATALLELAAEVGEARTVDRLGVLCAGLVEALDADWAVAVAAGEVIEWRGEERPERAWILAFLEGSDHLDGRAQDGLADAVVDVVADVVWARLAGAGITLAAGRSARAFHARERARTALLARVVDAIVA
jgi:hypothetical protein